MKLLVFKDIIKVVKHYHENYSNKMTNDDKIMLLDQSLN